MHMIKPNEIVRTIKLRFYNAEGQYSGALLGIEFLDKDRKTLLKVGIWEEQNPRYAVREMSLLENERIYGIRSGRRNSKWAYHYDVVVIIGRVG